jgi:hypothetical protein
MTPEQRKSGQEFAGRVRELARTAPDEASMKLMNKVASRLQVYYGMSRVKKKGLLVRMLSAMGPMTILEISDATIWPYKKVHTLVQELADEGKVVVNYQPGSGRSRADGLPRLLISAASDSPPVKK